MSELDLPTKSKKIGDTTYKVKLLPAGEGLEINALLYRALGPAIAEAAAGIPEGGGLGDVKWGAITRAVKELSTRIDAQDLRQLRDAFAPRTELTLPDGKKPMLSDVFDTHFAGRYARMYKWLLFCIEINFADFLDELPQGLRAGLAAAVQ